MNIGTVRHRNIGTVGQMNIGTAGQINIGTIGQMNIGTATNGSCAFLRGSARNILLRSAAAIGIFVFYIVQFAGVCSKSCSGHSAATCNHRLLVVL